jgi:hypothetical protein
MRFPMKNARMILIATCCFQALANGQQAAEMRMWTDQEGRSIRAAFIKVDGTNVLLTLENGTQATVPLMRFSALDQAFVKEAVSGSPAGGGAAVPSPSPVAAEPVAARGPLVWPSMISIPAKDLEITEGEKNVAERRYVYRSGSFQFESTEPLAGTVMREIARDFELTRSLFRQLPWGWEPKPINGEALFLAKLFATESEYRAAGGFENTSASSNKDFIFTKFDTLGLKKVGGRYAFDAKQDKEGDLTSGIVRLMLGDMRGFLLPWSSIGMEEFLRRGCYRNNSYSLDRPHNAIKERINFMARTKHPTDVDRMLKRLRLTEGPSATEVTNDERRDNWFDSMLLVFFFGYLDGDGKGTALHQYYQAVAKDAAAFREYNDSNRTIPYPLTGTRVQRCAELPNIVIQGRDDAKLREDMIAGFKTVGIKL